MLEIAYGAYENQVIMVHDKTSFLTLTPVEKMVLSARTYVVFFDKLTLTRNFSVDNNIT